MFGDGLAKFNSCSFGAAVVDWQCRGAVLPGRGRPPQAAAPQGRLEPVEKVLTGAPICCLSRLGTCVTRLISGSIGG
jgi:hypothetical protein